MLISQIGAISNEHSSCTIPSGVCRGSDQVYQALHPWALVGKQVDEYEDSHIESSQTPYLPRLPMHPRAHSTSQVTHAKGLSQSVQDG
jgi:hypothetical protein